MLHVLCLPILRPGCCLRVLARWRESVAERKADRAQLRWAAHHHQANIRRHVWSAWRRQLQLRHLLDYASRLLQVTGSYCCPHYVHASYACIYRASKLMLVPAICSACPSSHSTMHAGR